MYQVAYHTVIKDSVFSLNNMEKQTCGFYAALPLFIFYEDFGGAPYQTPFGDILKPDCSNLINC